jgi:putative DNA primase/helicase
MRQALRGLDLPGLGRLSDDEIARLSPDDVATLLGEGPTATITINAASTDPTAQQIPAIDSASAALPNGRVPLPSADGKTCFGFIDRNDIDHFNAFDAGGVRLGMHAYGIAAIAAVLDGHRTNGGAPTITAPRDRSYGSEFKALVRRLGLEFELPGSEAYDDVPDAVFDRFWNGNDPNANEEPEPPPVWTHFLPGPLGDVPCTPTGKEELHTDDKIYVEVRKYPDGAISWAPKDKLRRMDERPTNGGDGAKDDTRSLPVVFLQKLRPGGPWVLTAIVPDGKPTTVTARTADEVDAFVRDHNGRANIYYSVNPARTVMFKKTAKTDLAAIEYVLSDLDPAEGETPEAAKARYLEQLNDAFEPKPTAAIDSGNGIQGLWRLKERIALGDLVNGKFSAEDQAKIDDVEARVAAVMKRLGAKAGTQNIDRILRLPGTINLPNKAKLKKGRVACETKLLWFNDASYPLDVFPKEEPGKNEPGKKKDGGRDESGSGYGFRFMQDCHTRPIGEGLLARPMTFEEARAAILADENEAGEWARRVDERQLERAWKNSKPGAAPPHSEEALALAFAERHATTLRYVAKWGRWFIWDGTCWREDEKRQVFTLARELCREIAPEARTPTERKRIASAKTRAAVVSLASEDRQLAATTGQWDADLWLLNTPDGVVDLHTGKLREHRATDYMTKQTAASPKEEALEAIEVELRKRMHDPSPKTGAWVWQSEYLNCPRWMTFLGEITGGDVELQHYLQRIAGYCLTGVITEQELYFFYGSGNNGKGVWVRAVSGVMHDYHCTASIETFTVNKYEQHPTDLAGLCGARLVTASETEEGRHWAEARIKRVTGGDRIKARFMRQDFFEYFPQFKPLIDGNSMPSLRSVNKAIRRRFNRIPFAVTIPDDQVDRDLTEKLKAEWPGILAWAVEGCLESQRIGMCPPMEAKTVDVHIHRLRRQLEPHRITIETIWGAGYRIPAADRRHVLDMVLQAAGT